MSDVGLILPPGISLPKPIQPEEEQDTSAAAEQKAR